MMTKLQFRLIISWLGTIAISVFAVFIYSKPYFWHVLSPLAVIAIYFEHKFFYYIRDIVPTPNEFFSDHPIWKRFFIWYGFIMSAVAISLLTFAQSTARVFGENPLLLFSLIFGPLLIPLVAHQLMVYKALAHEPDA